MSANATTLHIGMELNYSGDVYVFRFGESGADDWNNMGDNQKASFEAYMYGRKWFRIDMNGQSKAVVRWNNWNSQTVDVESISGDDFYIYVSNNTNDQSKHYAGKLDNPYWYGLCIKNSLDNNWDAYTNNMTNTDGFKSVFTKTWTKEEVDNAKGSNNSIWFRFKHVDKAFFVEDGTYYGDNWTEFFPANNNTSVNWATPTTSYNHGTSASNSWQIDIPDFDYEKIVLTAKYLTEDNGATYKWQISADAYISKTLAYVENTYIGTFGSAANVDFSNVEGLTAKKLKVSAGTIIETNATTLFGGEGALLTAESAGPFSIPVAASASPDANNNLVAITKKVQLAQEPETGYTAYVLTNKKKDDTTGPLAFYKVNSDGTWCAAGTAYLKVANDASGAPDFIPFGETTGIDNLGLQAVTNYQYYTLDGRCVAQPTKGLYILNGKKVIIK